jgi:hypothetical protein
MGCMCDVTIVCDYRELNAQHFKIIIYIQEITELMLNNKYLCGFFIIMFSCHIFDRCPMKRLFMS